MAISDLDSADGVQQVSQATSPWVVSQSFDKAQTDAFGRQRVNIPNMITSLHFTQSSHDFLMNTTTTGTASATFSPAESALRLSVGTASGDSVIRQTKRYVKYNPGIGYVFTFALAVGAKKTNVRKDWGVFDNLNGFFFHQSGTALAIVTRSNASGSAVDTVVNQSSWNLDKLDGTGASGLTLDETKHQLWVIDHIWHGAGPVRFGVHIGGKIIYVHQVVSGNTLTLPFTRSPVLPLRVELTNTGTSASTTNFDVVCMTATAENGASDLVPSYSFHASNGLTSKSVSTSYIPLLSIRPRTTHNTIVNRTPIVPNTYDIFTNAAYLNFRIVLNATLTNANFAAVNTFSAVEFDTAATAYTGGTVISDGYTTNTTKGSVRIADTLEQFLLGLNIAGNTADILTIVAAASANNNPTYSVISWSEFQ